jgi:GrpB-like predicted nucleotidyltransferase (UPF0157 family)
VFDTVRDELSSALVPIEATIEHIGSTSVPGLAAKPVIDVLVGVRVLADVESKIAALGACGYGYVQKYERELPTRRYFLKSSVSSLRVHVHAVERGSRLWREHLGFRDALRMDPGLRVRYQQLKLQLAAVHADDKSAYTAAKAPFIQSVLASFADAGDRD